MPVPSAITDLSTTAASNSPAGSDNVFPDLDNYLRAQASFIALLRDGRGLSTEVSVASAATTDIGGAASTMVQITGTTTITSFGTNYLPRILRFAGALTLTHNATTLILPTAANITTAAGDMCLAVPVGTSGWRVLQYQRASEAAGFVSYLPAGSGAVATTVQTKLRETVSVKDFGAVGDGVTDDTAAIQAALNAALIVYVPPTTSYYKVSSELSLQSEQYVYGAGARSEIRQITTLLTVMKADTKTRVVVHNLALYACGTYTSQITGAGLSFISSSYCTAVGLHVKNHRGAGVMIWNTNDSAVLDCVFTQSPCAELESDTEGFCDVGVMRSSSRNIVRGNRMASGQHTGVLVQAVIDGNTADDNIVSNNVIVGAKVYGICAYRNSQALPILQSVKRTNIVGNVVDTVSGSVVSSITGTYVYGAGIYIQGAEDTVVTGNTVRNTHSYGLTYSELLSPAAIGCTNQTRVTISGNVVQQCGMYGIQVGDGNAFGEAVGSAAISGNVVTNTARSGIQVKQRERVSISGNAVDTTNDSGIEINNTSAKAGIIVSSNQVKNVTGVAAIEVKYATNALVSGNHCDTMTTHGVTFANSTNGKCIGNTIINAAVRGVQILSTSSNCEVIENTVLASGGSSVGYRFDVSTRYSNNFVSGATTDYEGAAAPWSTLTVNSTTPSVALGERWTTTNTLATLISGFTGGQDGQVINVVFNDANTTLDFSASNLIGNNGVDRLMSVGDGISAVFRKTTNKWYVQVVDS